MMTSTSVTFPRPDAVAEPVTGCGTHHQQRPQLEVQDANKILHALVIIRDNGGAAVKGLASRQGHRDDMKTVAVQAGTTVLPAKTSWCQRSHAA
jgi:hypothetical protein